MPILPPILPPITRSAPSASGKSSGISGVTITSPGSGYLLPGHSHGISHAHPFNDPGHSHGFSADDAASHSHGLISPGANRLTTLYSHITGMFYLTEWKTDGDFDLYYGDVCILRDLKSTEFELNGGRFKNFSLDALKHEVHLPLRRVVFAGVLDHVVASGDRWSFAIGDDTAVFSFEEYATAVYVKLRFG